jgi:hypothetical protein
LKYIEVVYSLNGGALFNTIRILEQIQKTDLEIGALEEEQSGFLKKIERITAQLEDTRETIETLGVEIDGLNGSLDEAKQRLTDNADKINRYEERIREVKNDRELRAINKEKNQASKAKRLIEQELAALEEKLGAVQSSSDELDQLAGEKNSELDGVNAEIEGKKAGWEEAIKQKQSRIDSLKVDLKSDIFKKYEVIKARSGGRAVVSVKEEACQGCYIHIPPQVYIQLKRGDEELITCPHCHRILYVEEEAQPEAV